MYARVLTQSTVGNGEQERKGAEIVIAGDRSARHLKFDSCEEWFVYLKKYVYHHEIPNRFHLRMSFRADGTITALATSLW